MKKALADYFPIYLVSLFIFLLFFILTITNRFLFVPKVLLFCLVLLVAALLGKLRILYKEWFVFFSFLYLFDSLRGTFFILTCKLNLPVHVLYAIKAEKFLFGQIPSVTLQQALLKNDAITWLEKLTTVVHGTHFVLFLFIGLIIWLYKSEYFRAFKSSFYWAIFLGVSGYFIIPTAPPWLVSEVFHIIPKLTRFNILIYNMSVPDLTYGFNTNPIAAMPSLHAAFPVLCCLILWRLYRWKAFVFFIYAFFTLFTIVYTGDHYVVDIIAGGLLAFLCYFFAFRPKKTPPPVKQKKAKTRMNANFLSSKNQKTLILGTLVLVFGISLGLFNKNQFNKHTQSYEYSYVPYYRDFFINETTYRQNFSIQLYKGNHFLFKKKYKKALFYFERALDVSSHIIEKKKAQMKIKQCERLLNSKLQ